MKADEGEGEGSEFSAVLESFSFSFFFLSVYRSTKRNKQARTRACTPSWKCVSEWPVCACVCVRVSSEISWLVASPVFKWRKVDVEKL